MWIGSDRGLVSYKTVSILVVTVVHLFIQNPRKMSKERQDDAMSFGVSVSVCDISLLPHKIAEWSFALHTKTCHVGFI